MLSTDAQRLYSLIKKKYQRDGEFRYNLDVMKRGPKFRETLDRVFGRSIDNSELDEIISELISADYLRMNVQSNEIRIVKPFAD